jgi:quercetin dioxygenase-like cupin family protein
MEHDDAMRDAVAALAVGVVSADEAEAVLAHIATCATCRAEYREFGDAVNVLATAAVQSGPAAWKGAALKERILTAAVAARPPVPRARSGYAHVVAREELIEFAPGISWAVVPTGAMTLVYWIFEPPACGELRPEFHPHTQGGVVLEGRMTLHYGDGTRQMLTAGDVYAIEAGTVHGGTFEERTVLFDVYAPNHAEFEALYRRMRERCDNGG